MLNPLVILATAQSFRKEFLKGPYFHVTAIFKSSVANIAFFHFTLAAPFILVAGLLAFWLAPR